MCKFTAGRRTTGEKNRPQTSFTSSTKNTDLIEFLTILSGKGTSLLTSRLNRVKEILSKETRHKEIN